jgi:cadmium resistance protein CadD (predicted permease)
VGQKNTTRNIAIGQYLGFAAILAVAVAAAFGATFLPGLALLYLGLLPLTLGIRAAIKAWKHRNDNDEDDSAGESNSGPKVLEVAAVTFANGGNNIRVYVPVFATAGAGGMSIYVIVFLILLAAWIAAGRFFATRPLIAKALSGWGRIRLPVVLIGVGLLILIEGGAFGL